MPVVCVIWGVALLSAIALSFSHTANASYRIAHNMLDAARAEATAEAAMNRAVLALLDPRFDQRWRVDGVARDISINGTKVRVAIQDELGRIDLNQADGSLLIGLLCSAGLDQQSASRLVDKILDWREPGNLKRLNGAKEQDYRAAGLAHRPRNGPFQSVDELKLVMGMTPELFRRVEPALTVHSGRPLIDPQFAPREALLALPTANADAVASLMAARAGPAGGIIDPVIPLKGRAFTIRINVGRPNGASAREAAIRITGNGSQPYWLLSWTTK